VAGNVELKESVTKRPSSQYQVWEKGLSYPVHIHIQLILLMVVFNEIEEVLPTKDPRTTGQRARVRTTEKEITQ